MEHIETKFKEYIDELGKIVEALLQFSHNRMTFSEILYKVDSVAYKRLFEEWVLKNLNNEGNIK